MSHSSKAVLLYNIQRFSYMFAVWIATALFCSTVAVFGQINVTLDCRWTLRCLGPGLQVFPSARSLRKIFKLKIIKMPSRLWQAKWCKIQEKYFNQIQQQISHSTEKLDQIQQVIPHSTEKTRSKSTRNITFNRKSQLKSTKTTSFNRKLN